MSHLSEKELSFVKDLLSEEDLLVKKFEMLSNSAESEEVKEKMMVAADAGKSELEKIALENERIKALLDGKTVVKVVAVPGRLINIVVK